MSAEKKERGHVVKIVGRWIVCAKCGDTKRKRGWWRDCRAQDEQSTEETVGPNEWVDCHGIGGRRVAAK